MKSVAELHAEHPFDPEERYWGYNTSLHETIAQAEELHAQDDPVAYLDELLESDYHRAMAINRALLALPAAVVFDNFGHQVAAWISSNISFEGHDKEINEVLVSRAGYDLEDLETSRLWEWNQHYSSNGKSILANYEFMRQMKDGNAIDNIDLNELLVRSTRPDITLSAKRLADYALIPIEVAEYNCTCPGGWVKDWSNDISETVGYSMWLDSPVGFALTYKGLPNAMAGLAMRSDGLMLYQLQGVQGRKLNPQVSRYSSERVIGKVKSRGLMPLDWQALLVSTTESLGQNLGVRQIGIQAGKNNRWTKPHRNEEEPHITFDLANRTYDATAKRLGFTQNSDDQKGNWHKSLSA